MINTDCTIKFSFYGFGIQVNCDDSQTLQAIKRDYSFFENDTTALEVFFDVFNQAPDYSKLPCLKAYLYTPRNICYRHKGISYIDYFGKGLTIIDLKKNSYRVFCSDPDLRHEIVYLSILSLVGQNLDSRKIHRVHGLGLEINNKAFLILLPSGGGKTTFLLDIIKHQAVKLISEDSPLIDASGMAIPFPLRIGVPFDSKPPDIAPEHLHFTKRMEFGPKYLIDLGVFKGKIVKKPFPVRYILCGQRCLGDESYILPLSKLDTLKEFVKNSVIGIGLYQGLEFLLQKGFFEILKKSGIIFSRFKNSSKTISKAKTYSFVIGSDRRKNAQIFLKFLSDNNEL